MHDGFGPYVVGDCLGVGGMATVHRATAELADGSVREVAIKRLLPQHLGDPQLVEQFVREGRLAARLRHPNIVRLFEFGRVEDIPYLAMELIQGDVLMVLMRRAKLHRQPVPTWVALSIAIGLCDGLDYAHFGVDDGGQPLGVIHRDLTPSNVVVTNEGRVKIIDFGVAKTMRGEFVTGSGLAKGKLGYMSMEALSGGPLDGRADIFSMGVVLWELVTGRRLFKAPSAWEVVELVREGRVPPPSELNRTLPTELDGILLRALAPDYVDRWASAAAMRVELEHLRRYYNDRCTPREVAAWKETLMALPPPPSRPDSAGEQTIVRLSSGGLEAVVDDWERTTADDDVPAEIDQLDAMETGSMEPRTDQGSRRQIVTLPGVGAPAPIKSK